ncbi:MAG: Crp/Fnr family transcriptional regulator [Candidatus Dormibacteraceae bacterium]
MAEHPVLDHPIFKGADPEALAFVGRQAVMRTVRRGQILGMPGEHPSSLHLLLSGRLRAYQLTADGRELLLELIEAGGFDGLLSLAGHQGHFSAAAVDSSVASLTLEQLERAMRADPAVASNLLRKITDRLANREEHLELVTLREPSLRLARQLLALARTVAHPEGAWMVIDLRLTHQMLADMLGMRRETATLHLGRLMELGAISFEAGRYRLDRQALQEMLGGEAPEVPASREEC